MLLDHSKEKSINRKKRQSTIKQITYLGMIEIVIIIVACCCILIWCCHIQCIYICIIAEYAEVFLQESCIQLMLQCTLTRFYRCLRICSCGTKPQHSENHHSVMTSSWEPQYHHDIIMRTPKITGKPKFSCSRGL